MIQDTFWLDPVAQLQARVSSMLERLPGDAIDVTPSLLEQHKTQAHL
jgi:hypothetical protein